MKHLDESIILELAAGHFHGDTRDEYMRHISACDLCGSLYTGQVELMAALTLEEPLEEVPPELKEAIFARIRTMPQPNNLDWSPELTKRLRVLLHTKPILDLRRWDALREDADTSHYDSVALAMRVLDRIIESTGLGSDVDHSALVRSLEPLLHRLDEHAGLAPDLSRHQGYITRLIERLRNDDDARRPFKIEYTDFTDAGSVRRTLELRLIEERFASDERIVLQLSNEAVNLFLGALNLEIEDAQAAIEAVIQSQLERGRFDEAAQAAGDAKFRSQQLQEKIERILRDTRRDITSVDWLDAVPRALREALNHIVGRLRIERHIAISARERLEHLEPGTHEAQRVAMIADLMDDCFDRHLRLHETLMAAHGVFFREQERQAFMPRQVKHLPNLFTGALEPLMLATRANALGALQDAMPALLGSNTPDVFSLRELIAGLLRSRRLEPQSSVQTTPDVWHEMIPEFTRFPAEVRDAARPYLLQVPAALSELLSFAGNAGEHDTVLEYISLQALHGFESNSSTGLRVRRAERKLEVRGFWGDDLELEAINSAQVN